MTTDESEIEEQAWIAQEREKVVDYLSSQHCEHAGVGEWPAFHVDPYIALWAVQSPSELGRIGWWAISGDLPTDYMSSSSGYHPRDAMRHFGSEWMAVSKAMGEGKAHPETKIGTPDQWPTMVPLLESRARLLREYADDDEFWDE